MHGTSIAFHMHTESWLAMMEPVLQEAHVYTLEMVSTCKKPSFRPSFCKPKRVGKSS